MAVENYTGVRVDQVMMLDFAGFVEVTDALGGVEMYIEQTIRPSTSPTGRSRPAGGSSAGGGGYIRQRKQFPMATSAGCHRSSSCGR